MRADFQDRERVVSSSSEVRSDSSTEGAQEANWTRQSNANAEEVGEAHDHRGAQSCCTYEIIEERPLLRECLLQGIASLVEEKVTAFSSVQEWLQADHDPCRRVVMLCLRSSLRSTEAQEIIKSIPQEDNLSVVLVGDAEEPDAIVATLQEGFRGFIPTSFSLNVAVQALRLVSDGGIFVPAASLIRACQHVDRKSISIGCESEKDLLTSRQAAVVRAIACGKANKAIAYELNMCESTVKVHVRNIMKKLRARNRTEVALIAQNLNLSGKDYSSTTSRS